MNRIPGSLSRGTLAAIGFALAVLLCLPAGAQTTRTWVGTSADMSTPGNWSSGVVPSAVDGDEMLFNGSSSFNALTFPGGTFSGNAGLGHITIGAGQTNAIAITNSGAAGSVFRLHSNAGLTIEAGAGAFSVGSGGNAFLFNLGNGTSNFVNNSSSLATIGSTLTFNATGGHSPNLTFSGTGDWLFAGITTSTVVNLTHAGSGQLTLSGSYNHGGSTTVTGGTLKLASQNSLQNRTLTMSGGGLVFDNGVAANAFTLGGLQGSADIALVNDASASIALTVGGNNATTLYSGDLSGAGSLVKTGSGTLTLSGNNTYTGGTTISDGTLQLSGNGTLGADTGALTVSGGTLDLGGKSVTKGAVTVSGGTIENGTLTGSSFAGHSGTVIADLAGSAALTKTTAGTLTLSGANTYTGTTTVSAGTLQFARPTSLYNNDSDNWVKPKITVASGATLGLSVGGADEFTTANVSTLLTNLTGDVSTGGMKGGSAIAFDTTNASGGNFTIADAIANTSGAGGGTLGLTKLGTGTLTLAGANTYTGATTVSAGTLQLSGDGTLGATGGALIVSGGTLDLGGKSVTKGAVTVSGGTIENGTLTGTGSAYAGQSGTVSAVLAGSIGLTKTTSGVLTLSGANTYTGATTISAGTLIATHQDALRHSAVSIAAAALELRSDDDATFTMASLARNTNTTAVLHVGPATAGVTGKTITIDTGSEPIRFSNQSGTFRITGAEGYRVLLGRAITGNSGNVYINSDIDAVFSQIDTGSTTQNANIRFEGSGTTTVGAINRIGGYTTSVFVNNATGRLSLTGESDYNGATTISAGTLEAARLANGGSASAIGQSGNAAANLIFGAPGAILRYTGSDDVTTDRSFTLSSGAGGGATLESSGTGTLTFSGGPALAYGTNNQTRVLTLGGTNAGDNTFGKVIANNGTGATSVIKVGSGTWVLNQANTYTGGTTIGNNTADVGTLVIAHNTALGTGNVQIVSNSGNGNLATLALASSTGITVANNFNTSGEGQGRDGIIRNMQGNNTITGNFTLTAGGGSTRIHSDGGSLTLTGDITPNTTNRQLLLGGVAAGTISGTIADGSGANTLAGVQKFGSGTWILSGNNTYTGTTTVHAGTLQVGDGGSTGTLGQGAVVNNGTLVLDRDNAWHLTNQISGSGNLVKQGAGTVMLHNQHTYTGSTVVAQGTLQLVGPATSDPLSYWAMSDGSGTTLSNSVAGMPAGSLLNGPSWVTGPGGAGTSAVQFSGGSTQQQHAELASGNAELNAIGSGEFTVSAWVKSTNSGQWYNSIVSNFGPGGSQTPFWGLGWMGSNTLGFTFRNEAGARTTIDAPLGWGLDDQWHQIIGVHDADGRLHLYLDGVLHGSSAGVTSGSAVSDKAILVARHGGTYVAESVAGVGIWDRALSVAEVEQLYIGLALPGGGLPQYTALAVAAGATLDLNGLNQTVGSLADHGAAGGGSVLLGSATLTTGGDNSSTAFSGVISGSGSLVKTGSGTFSLSGASTYTGATTVSAGTLLVNGSLGNTAVAVHNGGTLGGTGSIGGAVTVHGGGLLSPGTSPGVLTMGSLALSSGSTTLMEIEGLVRGDEYDGIDITVDGGLTYGGTLSLAFNLTEWVPAGTVFDLFNFTGTPTGAFAEVVSTGFYAGGAGDWLYDDVDDTFSLEFGWQTLLFSHATGDLTVIPEPGTWLLLLAAAACGLLLRRRRK